VNFSFEFVEGESLLIMLDMKGICVSGGSACSSGSLAPSHVLKAIGLSDSLARGALRMTLSAETTKEAIDTTVAALTELVKKLRNMSPKYEGYLRGIEKSETAE
jgi:cysteine desulfurase